MTAIRQRDLWASRPAADKGAQADVQETKEPTPSGQQVGAAGEVISPSKPTAPSQLHGSPFNLHVRLTSIISVAKIVASLRACGSVLPFASATLICRSLAITRPGVDDCQWHGKLDRIGPVTSILPSVRQNRSVLGHDPFRERGHSCVSEFGRRNWWQICHWRRAW